MTETAALDPLTGLVLAIGYHSTDTGRTRLDIRDDEAAVLAEFWTRYQQIRQAGRQLVGHNIFGFGLPFLVKRSWLVGIDVPGALFHRSRWLDNTTFTDTLQLWSAGGRSGGTLDVIAQAMGVGGQPEGVDGSMFAHLLQSDPETARAYLENDLMMTARVAERMGCI